MVNSANSDLNCLFMVSLICAALILYIIRISDGKKNVIVLFFRGTIEVDLMRLSKRTVIVFASVLGISLAILLINVRFYTARSEASTMRPKQLRPLGARTTQAKKVERFEAKGCPTLSRIIPKEKISISEMCHILLFYGLGPTDLKAVPNGLDALEALTNEKTAVRVFGKSPFIRTRDGLRYYRANDPLGRPEEGESHRDVVLATFAALDLPLSTPMNLHAGQYSISHLLAESVATFYLQQREPAWTAIAYAKYLPPRKEWVNRFGEKTSFSDLANALMQNEMSQQSCAGTHIFEALVRIHRADTHTPVLDRLARAKLHNFLQEKVNQIIILQEIGGAWNWNWCDSVQRNSPMTLQKYLLVTGHLLECLDGMDASVKPSPAVFNRAAKWLEKSLADPEIPGSHPQEWVCPFTHAARSFRRILSSHSE